MAITSTDFSQHVTWLVITWLDKDTHVMDEARTASSQVKFEEWIRNYCMAMLEAFDNSLSRDLLRASLMQIDFELLARRYYSKWESYRQRQRKGFTS